MRPLIPNWDETYRVRAYEDMVPNTFVFMSPRSISAAMYYELPSILVPAAFVTSFEPGAA